MLEQFDATSEILSLNAYIFKAAREEIASIFITTITPRSALFGTKDIPQYFSSLQCMLSKPN